MGIKQGFLIVSIIHAGIEDRLVIVLLRHGTSQKKTFPLSAQLGGKVKQQRACKGLYEIFLTRGGGLGSQPVH